MAYSNSHYKRNLPWDLFCSFSIIGIWPRFIEPKLIYTTKLNVKIEHLPNDLQGFKILQISDLHLHPAISDRFLQKLIKKVNALKPDLITFTGDFLCYGKMTDRERLLSLLRQFKAPYGCYAVLGNHDYDASVSINPHGDYDIIDSTPSSLKRAFSRLNESITLTKQVTSRAKKVPLHSDLLALLADSPFKLLHNATDVIKVNKAKLNITGLGEYMLGRLDPQTAFRGYDTDSPGIVLMHNPDGLPLLQNYPGNIVLSGHTHGGQVNLPWMWKKFTLLENMKLKKGLIHLHDKWIYVNRGLGSILPFRWFSPPEILLLTLEAS